MKVAIIGAGISGLSCAITLERHGIVADVFEQYGYCGQRTPFVVCMMHFAYHPIKVADPLTDLARRFGISLTPINVLMKNVTFSPRQVATAKGPLGYMFERGPGPRSLESQLYGSLTKTRIQFDTVVGYKELQKSYDRVVVATGSAYQAKEMGTWSDIMRTWVRGAVVKGRFEPTTWVSWFDKSYANNGFAYLCPFDATRASLALTVSDVQEKDTEKRWRLFRETEKITYLETESFLIEQIAGISFHRQMGNVLLIGQASGLMGSVLGFGLYEAVASGALAAQAIYEDSSYENKIAPLIKRIYLSYILRTALNEVNNKGYDNMLRILSFLPVSRLVYNSKLNILAKYAHVLEMVKGIPPLYDQFFPR